MLNLCVFIFIVYAASYSAKVILFGNKRQQRRKSYSFASSAHRTYRQNISKRKNNVISINKAKNRTQRKNLSVLLIFYKKLLEHRKLDKTSPTEVVIVKK